MEKFIPSTPNNEQGKENKIPGRGRFPAMIYTDEKTGKQQLRALGVGDPVSGEYHKIVELTHGDKTVLIGKRGAEDTLLTPPAEIGGIFRSSGPYRSIGFDERTGKLVAERGYGVKDILDPDTGDVLETIERERTKIPPMEHKRNQGKWEALRG